MTYKENSDLNTIKIEMCSVNILDYKLNAELNKKVFNLDLKIAKERLSRITKGKLFYSLGAAC